MRRLVSKDKSTRARLDPGRSGSQALRQGQPIEQETPSASVELEDIIQDYDAATRPSISNSFASSLNLRSQSQTFFTADGKGTDDSTSFYSALQDGFSLNQYDCRKPSEHSINNDDFSWVSVDSNEKDMMLPKSNFQVFWSDVSYKIEPTITFFGLWYEFEQFCKSTVPSLLTRHSWSYDVKKPCTKNEPVTIIQELSGSFKTGELTGVMGPSGAGKTSLLNFLARRRDEGYTGQLYLENSNRRVRINTIPQHEHLTDYLTVRESLTYASKLKNSSIANFDHEKAIEQVSNLLGLEGCLDTRVKKISGGQSKRLAIAQELLSKPDILILDEPTSGLDSRTCYRTVSVLKDITKSAARGLIEPIAILLTIHQPQQEVFDLFDKIYVMARGGLAIYNGPPHECLEFVEKYAGIQIPDKDYNPASFLIEIASGEYGEEPIKALADRVKFEFAENRAKALDRNAAVLEKQVQLSDKQQNEKANRFNINMNTEKIFETNPEIIQRFSTPNGTKPKQFNYIDPKLGSSSAKGSSAFKGHFLRNTIILTKRCWLSQLRDPKQLICRVVFSIFLPCILAWWMTEIPGKANACPKFKAQYKLADLIKDDDLTSTAVQEEMLLSLENLSLLFVLLYATSCANMCATTLSFTLDLQSSLKEFYNGWYSMPSYLTARFIAEIPLEIILPSLVILIGFPLSGQIQNYDLMDGYRLLFAAAGSILASMACQTMGMVFGAIYLGHVSTALFAVQGASLPLVFLSGFVVRTKNMSKFVYLLSYFSYYRFSLDIALISRYGYDVCKCDPSSITGKEAEIVGVPSKAKSFTQYWIDQQSTVEDTNQVVNSTNQASNSTVEDENDDIFQLFAQQVSLYNSNGVVIRSCEDVKPFTLHDLSLSEKDMVPCFIGLIILVIGMKIALFIIVKLVLRFRTAL